MGIQFRGRRLILNIYRNKMVIINFGDEREKPNFRKKKKSIIQGCDDLSAMIF